MSRPSVREAIAAARAELAKSKAIRGGAEDERQAFVSSGVPGVKRTAPPPRSQTDVEILGHTQKSIRSLIANAKGTGIMNLSSRDLTEVPLEIWNMYHVDPDTVVVDFSSSGDAWYNAVDLTRLIAADNKITFIDTRIREFGALVTVDFRTNQLTTLPDEFGELKRLVNLNLSSNKFEVIPPVIFTLSTLVTLHLANNQLSGALNSDIGNLSHLEILDLTGNKLTELPQELSKLKAIRKLHLSKNNLKRLPINILTQMPKLTELEILDNKLSTLFSGFEQLPVGNDILLPSLTRLDARNSCIERITDIGTDVNNATKPKIQIPVLKELMLSQNMLSSIENLLMGTPQLYHLDVRANNFTTIPEGVLDLTDLRHLDMAGNRMEHVPSELGSMVDLTTFIWEHNPTRNVPRNVTTTEALMKLLKQRQETEASLSANAVRVESMAISSSHDGKEAISSASAPSHLSSTKAASSHAVATPASKKPIQNLNLAKKALKELSVGEIQEACSDPQTANLDFNALTFFPKTLQEVVGRTLTQISINHNKIAEFPFALSFPLLIKLDLSDNLITSLSTMTAADSAEVIGLNNFPNLNELHLSANRLTELPVWLPKTFPKLKTLNGSRNKIAVIDPKSFEGLVSLDLSGNEIGTLPPLLGNVRSIKSLSLDGNLFRVPRRQIMDQGTEAVMEYLRGRIPA
ncbi:Ras suppressor protein 1 [Lobosporangium transversale]|uniref:Disease resistance R13L4/SHOC-2-like LRR domain-containing protein n=1 Tax=Lobosporangium transversale TaxID=64571 RepID=A0A1Y2GDY2_9FUNG|nr:hypothetical protein BCR41DRAFT_399505 [Lobosporangium transversale]KAF9909335.1 Ras suppressor protein 1 [Lobosporangium transversale]ORZ08071.1 hypothetical protein BCR41DRAFT_399505 [Lobosporangium transversale]|eukprot:XP_021878305.1 hypothetical protein BCR41DRAFT_399505 [Lobosporangium transversale]